jgi:predicted ester cyclase
VRTRSEQLVAEGDFVCERYSCSFRHTREFRGIAPTGKRVEIFGFAVYRLEQGRVVEAWSLSSALTLVSQLGVISVDLVDGEEMQ